MNTDIRIYLRKRRKELGKGRSTLGSNSSRKAYSSAIAEVMFVEQYLDEIDPTGKTSFAELLKNERKILNDRLLREKSYK